MTEDRDRAPESTTLASVLERFVRSRTAEIRTGTVGSIVAYDAATQRADVQVVVRSRFEDGESLRPPVLVDVPVRFPCGGGYALTFPLVAGDFVWLDFGERSLDEWKAIGGDDVEPRIARRFHAADAVAYAGIRPTPSPLQSASATDLVAGEDAANGKVLRIGPSGIMLGTGQTVAGYRADVLAVVDGLLAALSTATVATSLGPQPLDPATLAEVAKLRSALATLLVP